MWYIDDNDISRSAMDDGLDQFNRQDKLKLTDSVPHDTNSSEEIQDRCHKTRPKVMYTHF